MLSEFGEFLKKFNVIPAAIGLVLALAIVPVMEALVDVIIQIVGRIAGSDNPGEILETMSIADILIGGFLSALVSFILIAFVVFMLVKMLNRAGAGTDPAPTPDQALLTEIRDSLARR